MPASLPVNLAIVESFSIHYDPVAKTGTITGNYRAGDRNGGGAGVQALYRSGSATHTYAGGDSADAIYTALAVAIATQEDLTLTGPNPDQVIFP